MRSSQADSAARTMHKAIIELSAAVKKLSFTAMAPMLAKAAAITDAAKKGMNIDYSFWWLWKEKSASGCEPRRPLDMKLSRNRR